MQPDKRQHPRKIIEADVAFQVAGNPRLEARYRDVSLGGMFIETEAVAPYGTPVRVFLRLPGLKDEVTVDTIVRWSKPGGMGVQFGVMGARETHALIELLAGN
jgi:type IV pilus assembly protein PilZ